MSRNRFLLLLFVLSFSVLVITQSGTFPTNGHVLFASEAAPKTHTSLIYDVSSPTALDPTLNLRYKGQFGGVNAVAVKDSHVYAGIGPSLEIFDVSNSNNLASVAQIGPFVDTVADVALAGNRAYLAVGPDNLLEGRLFIIDISDPAKPVELGSYRPSLSQYSPHQVAVSLNYVYLTGTTDLRIINVSNPASPQEVGIYNSSSTISDIVVSGNYAYLIAGTNAVHIINVSNPAQPVLAGQYYAPDTKQIAIAGSHMYIARGGEGLEIVNVANPGSPVLVSSHVRYAASVMVVGNKAYIGGLGRVYTLDVTNLLTPTEVGYTGGFGAEQLLNFGENAIALEDGYLTIFRLSDWPFKTAQYGTGWPADLILNGTKAIESTNNGLYILDVAKPAAPVEIGYFSGSTGKVAINGSYLYFINHLGLKVINIGNPATLVEAGSNSELGTDLRDIAVSGSHAYVAASYNGLQIINISNPTSPILVRSFSVSGGAYGVTLSGNYAYVIGNNNRVHIINISNPASPVSVGFYDAPQSPLAISVSEKYAYVAAGSGGLRIVDVSNPANPIEVWQSMYLFASKITLQGKYAYVAGVNDLYVFDVSNASAPVEVGYYSLPDRASAIAANDAYVYVATAESGMQVLQFSLATSTIVNTGTGSLVSSVDSTSYSFSANTFSSNTTVVHVPLTARDIAVPGDLLEVGHIFDVSATSQVSHQPVQPNRSYQLSVSYTETQIAPVRENTLALYYWDGSRWTKDNSSVVNAATNTVTANPNRFATWMLAGTASNQVHLPLVAQNYAGVDLKINRLEITQSIQDAGNSVPLVTNRRTIVRVHAETLGEVSVPNVYLSLSAYRNGVPLPGSPLVYGPWTVFPHPATNDFAESFNISIPSSWLSGQVTFSAHLDSSGTVPESNEQNNRASQTVQFYNVPALNIKIVPIIFTDVGTNRTCKVPGVDEISDWLMRAYPVSNIQVSFRAPLHFSGSLGSSNFPEFLDRVTALKYADGAPESQIYYGLVPAYDESGTECIHGGPAAGLGWIGKRAAVGISSVNPNLLSNIDGGDSAGQIAAHEIGHNFGLWHAPCGIPSGADINFPHPNASIGYDGFDSIRNRIWSPIAPDYTKDMMSYCGPSWFSDYNYRKLFIDQQTHGTFSYSDSTGNSVMVRITFDEEGNAVFHPVYQFSGASISESSNESGYRIDLLDTNGKVVASQSVELFTAGENGLSSRAIYASIAIPEATIAKVRLSYMGQPLAERPLVVESGLFRSAPLLLQQTEAGLMLKWEPKSDPALIRFTTDDGNSWTTLGIDVLGGELLLKRDLFPQGIGRIEVHFSDVVTVEREPVLSIDLGEALDND